MALQDEQAPIDLEIVEGAISSTPEDWDNISLKLNYEWADDPDELGAVSLSLNNDKNDFDTPNDELFLAVQKLNKLYHRYGVSWIKANYHISQNNDGQWKYEAKFQY